MIVQYRIVCPKIYGNCTCCTKVVRNFDFSHLVIGLPAQLFMAVGGGSARAAEAALQNNLELGIV